MLEENKAVKLTDEETVTVTGGAYTGDAAQLEAWKKQAMKENFNVNSVTSCNVCGAMALFRTNKAPYQLNEGDVIGKCFNCGDVYKFSKFNSDTGEEYAIN